jgi:hypothetical protein
MKLRILFLFMVAAVLVASCNDAAKPPVAVKSTPTPSTATPPVNLDSHGHAEGSDAPRISLAEAKKDFDAGTAVFIDTHAPEQYAQQHIPGSINVPANNMEPHLNKIPKGKKIIAYCS